MQCLVRCPVVAALLLGSVCRAGEAQLTAKEIVARLEAKATSPKTLELHVSCLKTEGKTTAAWSWVYYYKSPSFKRIDCKLPVNRLLLFTENDSWQYNPDGNTVIHTDLTKLDAQKKSKFIMEWLAPVMVKGLRFDSSGLDEGAYELIGTEKQDKTVVYHVRAQIVRTASQTPYWTEARIDGTRWTLMESTIKDKKGKLIYQTKAANFVECKSGVWFPRDIDVCSYGRRKITEKYELRKVKVDEPLPDELFMFQPPKGARVLRMAPDK